MAGLAWDAHETGDIGEESRWAKCREDQDSPGKQFRPSGNTISNPGQTVCPWAMRGACEPSSNWLGHMSSYAQT